ncbi:hypothetical protein FTV88_1764 [Heliorestis convoluta]|uniref:Uncharacterized protein n=1 Tax=Heliorestis convoluta TaxID=356322 RepID=A0A5Q2N3I8_9FIRM|nr:hypothetical protein FTV88_1764 [Heliorestis convoluta]
MLIEKRFLSLSVGAFSRRQEVLSHNQNEIASIIFFHFQLFYAF